MIIVKSGELTKTALAQSEVLCFGECGCDIDDCIDDGGCGCDN